MKYVNILLPIYSLLFQKLQFSVIKKRNVSALMLMSASLFIAGTVSAESSVIQFSEPNDLENQSWLEEGEVFDAQNVTEKNSTLQLTEESLAENVSLGFDGSDMKAEDQDAGDYINGLSEITVSMWVKSNEINTDKGFLNGGHPDNKDDQLVMRYDKDGWGNTLDRSNTIKIGFTIDGVEVNANASSNTQTTDWQHVVMTWSSGNDIKLYIDGVRDTGLKIASSNADELSPSGVITDLNHLVLGQGPSDSGSSWNGNIDNFHLFGREITESEVTQLYNQENVLNSDSDLLTHYPMDEGSGSTLQDSSGNNNDATIDGATWNTLYSGEGYRIANPISLDKITSVDTFNIQWDGDGSVYTQINESNAGPSGSFPENWQKATDGSAIPGLSQGDDLSGKYLWVRQDLSFARSLSAPHISHIQYNIGNHTQYQDPKPQMGMGLQGVHDWSTQLPFINHFKLARGWIGHDEGANKWSGVSLDQFTFDENGYPTSLPEVNGETASAGTVFFTDMGPEAVEGGRYVVLYDGEGTIEYRGSASKIEEDSEPGRHVIDFTPTSSLLDLRITETDPNNTGNNIRNIRVIREDQLDLYQSGETFNPKWIEKIDQFEVLRFMDWMETNNSDVSQWTERPQVDSHTWTNGVPLEIMIELSNQTNIDPWFNIPHKATDAYIQNFAQMVKDDLDPELQAHFEFSNEVWNWQFDQAQYAHQQGQNRWGTDVGTAWLQWYGMRSAQMAQILDTVYGSQADERLVKIISTQTASQGREVPILEAPEWVAEGNPAPYTFFDAFGITGYFSGRLGHSTDNYNEVKNWIQSDREAAFDKAFQVLKGNDTLLPDPGDSVFDTIEGFRYHRQVADDYNLDLVTYEAGTHIVGVPGEVKNDEEFTDFLIELNRRLEMEDVYNTLFEGWQDAGGNLFTHFVDVGRPSDSGSWGALAHLNDTTPRWNAITHFADQWSETILNFDSNGGSAVQSIRQYFDTVVNEPNSPTREGYTFTSWSPDFPETIPLDDQTYTAQWKANEYTLTFDSAGGSTVNSITQDYDTNITTPDDPTREGYTFTGWDKTVPETMPAEDQTYTAQWKANEYTLTFDSAGGSTVESITQDYDTSVTTPDDPTREGYTFTGWDKTVPETMPAEDQTYTAQWEINQYTLTFDSAGGSTVNSITQDYDTNITTPDDPTREGYTFTGWDKTVPETMPAEDQTYTAQWKVFVPVISELDVISTPTSDSTPTYSFISPIDGTITYYGECQSSQSQAQSGVNTITFNPLSDGIYTDCALTVTHANGTLSNRLDITEFTIDTTSMDNKEDEAQDEQGSSEEGEEQENTSDQDEEKTQTPQDNSNNNNEDGEDLEPIEVDNEEQGSSEEGEEQEDQENTSDQDEEESQTPQNTESDNQENRGQTSEQRFEEPQAPNNGDGNNDGIQDSEQSNVATYLNQVTTSYNTMTVNEEENNQIRSLRSVPESDVGNDERYVYPMGLYEFTVDLDKPGDTADVTIYTDQVYDTDIWEYRKYDGSDNGFTDISSEVTYRTAFNGEQEVTTISYSIVDGGPLDEDGEVNGTIVDPAGPALLNQDVTPPDTGDQPVNLLLYGLVFMTGGGLVTWVFRDKISL